MIGMVTVTGYGVSAKRPDIFLVAAAILLFAFLCDLMLVLRLAVPFAYRAFIVEESDAESEGIGTLFLAFGSKSQAALCQIRRMKANIERQRAFRRFYAFRNIYLKAAIFALGSVGEVVLWLALRGSLTRRLAMAAG